MLERSVTASPTRRLVAYMLRYRRGFALGLACTTLSTVASLATPWVLKHAVDDLAQGVTGAKLRTYASLILGAGARRGRLPLPDAPHHRRRVAAPRVRPAQRLLRAAADALARELPREPHRRPDVAGDQRPERGAHDGGAGGDVLGQHDHRVRAWRSGAHARPRRAPDDDRAGAAPVRVDRGARLRIGHPPAVRGDPGPALRR